MKWCAGGHERIRFGWQVYHSTFPLPESGESGVAPDGGSLYPPRMKTMRIRHLLPLLLLALPAGSFHASQALAQSVALDEGTFLVFVDGRSVGSESFAIRRSGAGGDAQIIATAEIRMDRAGDVLEIRPALQAQGAEMAVSAYQVKITGSREEEIYVTLGDRRYHTKVVSARGEQEREYRAQTGTLLLDSEVAHQFYFLRPHLERGESTLPVIVPRESRQVQLRLIPEGREAISVAGQQVEARRFRLETSDTTRIIWFDDQDRVLQVENPGTRYRAVRDAVPS